MSLCQALNEKDGEEKIVEWVGRLLYENLDVSFFNNNTNKTNIAYIRMETVKVLYEIFHVKMLNGMEI